MAESPPVFNPLKMVSLTMRLPRFMKEAITEEARKRVTRLEPEPIEARVVREAIQEWMERRGLYPKDMPGDTSWRDSV